jgi:predicted XRE-type DNA-binding protein
MSPLKYDIVRYSPKLRETIKLQIKRKGVNVAALSRELGIRRQRITSYLSGSTKDLTQWKIIKIAAKIGVRVSLTIEIDD